MTVANHCENPTEAKCPSCNLWSPVCWFEELPPGGYWWSDNSNGGGCPRCGYIALVETECEFRKGEFSRDEFYKKKQRE